MEDSKELYYLLIASGVFVGTLLIIGLTFSGVAIYKHLKKKKFNQRNIWRKRKEKRPKQRR